MANTLPARLGRNYLQKANDRATLHEQRSHQLAMEKLHLELSLDVALRRIKELESVVKIQEQVIDQLRTKPKRRAIG